MFSAFFWILEKIAIVEVFLLESSEITAISYKSYKKF